MKAFGGKPVVRICHDIEKREKKVACFVDRRALVAFRDYNIYNIIEFNWIHAMIYRPGTITFQFHFLNQYRLDNCRHDR
jgi:hypothetical protein